MGKQRREQKHKGKKIIQYGEKCGWVNEKFDHN